ncbi:MAG: ATP-binding protein [Elusimicrobia bacterium]|nr:ATP-binding protein [Elusimicrobiota bacterium]
MTKLSSRAKLISGLALFWLLLSCALLLIYQRAYHSSRELTGRITADLVNQSITSGLEQSMLKGGKGKNFHPFLVDAFSDTPGFHGAIVSDLAGRPVWASSGLGPEKRDRERLVGLIAAAASSGYHAERAADGCWTVLRLLPREGSCSRCHQGQGRWIGAVLSEGTTAPALSQAHKREEIAVFASIVALLVSGLLSFYWLLARYFVRPLAALAESIKATDMDNPAGSKLELAAGKEMGVVIDRFNSLLDRLAESKKALRSSEEQFRQAQKMEAVGRLAGGVAHDFNNLITAINGYGSMLLRSLPPDDARRQDAEEILVAGDRAAALTRRLLAFSRKQVLNPVVLDLNAAVEGASKMLCRLIGEDVRLEVNLGPSPCCITIDPNQVDQVLMNLAVNARDAMPAGGELVITADIADMPESLGAARPGLPAGRLARLTVSDTGTGMTPEVRGHLFEPFFTTKAQGKGTGLGLSTVYGIVKQSGGDIEVETSPGKGTKFLLYFPLSYRPPEAERAAEAAPRGGNETVLLVEDEESLLKLGRRVLSGLGYSVLAAADGAEALTLLSGHGRPVDLLVTDIRLPGMDGGELARLVSARCPGVKILYVSGRIDPETLAGLPAGDNFLQKPFSPDTLAAKVRRVLGPGT